MKYMAPEIVKTGSEKILHGKHVDVWALGVSIYNMLSNDFPFHGRTIPELQQALLNDEPDLSKAGELTPILGGILQKSIDQRTTVKDLITHPWLTENGANSISLDLSLISSELIEEDYDTFSQKVSLLIRWETDKKC